MARLVDAQANYIGLDNFVDQFLDAKNKGCNMSDFVRKFMNNAEKHQAFIDQMAKYWEAKRKDIDIKDMHFKLSAGGCRYADFIIQNEKHIDRYIGLKNQGKSGLEIAHILDVEIEKNNRIGHFPWISTVSLLYPIGAIVYIATQTPASIITIISYGLANLGYLLLAAGIFAGKFSIFKLRRRWQVFVAALTFLVIGIILTTG